MFSTSPSHPLAPVNSRAGEAENQAHKDQRMHLTIVGSGDAFGSGGRSNTCLRLDCSGGEGRGQTLVVDFEHFDCRPEVLLIRASRQT